MCAEAEGQLNIIQPTKQLCFLSKLMRTLKWPSKAQFKHRFNWLLNICRKKIINSIALISKTDLDYQGIRLPGQTLTSFAKG